MSDDKRFTTLGAIFDDEEARLKDRSKTPEFQEHFAELQRKNADKARREDETRLKWEADNKPSPFDIGRIAADNGDDRDPPEDITGDDAQEWLEGYDDWVAEQEAG